MRKNMNKADRLIRIPFSVLFIIVMLNSNGDMMISVMAAVLAFYCLLSALLEICIVYAFLDIDTRHARKKDRFY